MEAAVWKRIQEVYHSALSIPQSERTTFVKQACGSDVVMEQEIISLLDADDSLDDFLEPPIAEAVLKIIDGADAIESGDSAGSSTGELVGLTIDGRYLIERKLDRGGVGVVYLARDLRLHRREVVVKVLLEKSLQSERVIQKFHQEKEALARVNHPGVVKIVDAGELFDGKPYIVMQYVEGTSLREVIKANPEGMELRRVARLIKQIGEALSAVHEKRIYHRDLKPENIMLQRFGRGEEQVQILDFGVAKVKESVIAPSTITGVGALGTILYMSPEQLRGDKVTAASDIYSLALIAYEMVTGRRPFKPDTVAHLAEMQRQGVFAKPALLRPRLPREAEELILRGLALDPKTRPQLAGYFGDELSRVLLNEDDDVPRNPIMIAGIPLTQAGQELKTTDNVAVPEPLDTIPTPFQSAEPPFQTLVGTQVESHRRIWPIYVVGAVVIATLVVGAYWLISRRGSLFGNANKTASDTSGPHRSLAYSLTGQKMRDGMPYKQPFESSGQEIFESGYKFRLNLNSRQAGYLYVFNEGPPEKDRTNFTIIYPTPLTNEGSARLEQYQDVQTSWNTFSGQPGTERFWIVWSKESIPELEIGRYEAFKNKEGAIRDVTVATSLKEYLSKHSEPAPETTKDTAKQRTNVRANGDLLVKLVELEHR